MTKPLSIQLQDALQFTEQTKNELHPSDETQRILALQSLAKKIIHLFAASKTDTSYPPNSLAERCFILPKFKVGTSSQEYAQKCVLTYPFLFPYFTQLFPELMSSFEQVIDKYLTDWTGSPIYSRDLPSALIVLCKIMPETTDAFEVLVDKIEKTYADEGVIIKKSIYATMANICDSHDQLTDYACNNPSTNKYLMFKIAQSKLLKDPLPSLKICTLLSRITEAFGWGCLPPWLKSQILEIKDLEHQRDALSLYLNFLDTCAKEKVSFKQFTFLVNNPLMWVTLGDLNLPKSFNLIEWMIAIAKNEADKNTAEEMFQTFRKTNPLSELIPLPDYAKLSLLLFSLAHLQGVSKEVCDALSKHVCTYFEEGGEAFFLKEDRHLKICFETLFLVLRAEELDSIDKEYLLNRILKEPFLIPCMHVIQSIAGEGGVDCLKKISLINNSFNEILEQICPEAQIHEEKMDPEKAKMTAQILSSEGFKKETSRDSNYELKSGQTISEVQGTAAFCETTLQYVINTPSVLSPAYLRSMQEVNKILSLILRYKRFGHAFNLENMIKLPDGTNVNLEGFNETFVIPMLRAMFDAFASIRKDLVSGELANFVEESLSKAVWHDNASDKKIDEIHKLIHDPSNTYPVIVSSGWIWHSTQVIFYRGFLYYCNCGADCGANPGICVLKINNKEKVTPEFLKRIASRLAVKHSEYTSLEKIKKELDCDYINYMPMKQQKVGNCIYVNTKTAIFVLIQLWILGEDLESTAKPIYNAFSQFDKETVLRDFLIDLEEASTDKIDAEENKNYLEGLNTVADLFEKWALAHLRKNKKISSNLLIKALTLISLRD